MSPTSGSTTQTSAGSVLMPHDFITNVQKRLGNRTWTGFGQCRLCGSFLDTNLNTEKPAAPPKPLRGTAHAFAPSWVDIKIEDPSITTKPRGITATHSRPADLFTAAAVAGRSATVDVCVASPTAAAARGDAAQAAFDRKLSNYRHEILDLRNQGILCRLLVWTADGRPHTAVTRTLHCAADIASSRNGQQMLAKALQDRWKHEIQTAPEQR